MEFIKAPTKEKFMAIIQGDGYAMLKQFYANPLTTSDIQKLGISPGDLEILLGRNPCPLRNIDKTGKTPVFALTTEGKKYVEQTTSDLYKKT